MSTIVLNDQAIDLLKQCTTSAVLRDSEGNVIGYFERRGIGVKFSSPFRRACISLAILCTTL